jgi:hypothetical protein
MNHTAFFSDSFFLHRKEQINVKSAGYQKGFQKEARTDTQGKEKSQAGKEKRGN